MSERLATVELAGLSGAVSLGRRIYECYSGIDPAGCLRKRNSLILLCVNGGGKTGQMAALSAIRACLCCTR